MHFILKGPETGMIQRVFKIQWDFPCKGDWAIQIKADLNDFEIENNLNKLKLMSKHAFKVMIKSKAKDYAFRTLCQRKESYSKMKKLNYNEFKIQEYLQNKNFTFDDKKTIFKYRTRMLLFGENFRAGRDTVLCPLCLKHSDSQFEILNCTVIREDLEKQGVDISNVNLEDIYSENISDNSVKVLKTAMETRNSNLKGTLP